MGLEHRERPAVGRPVPPRVDLDRARRHAAAQLPRPDARAAAPGARARAAPPGRRRSSIHHRTHRRWCDPEAAFVALYGDREHAVWLDSARAEPGLARFSFMGAPDGPLGQVVRYDVATRALTVERADGARSCGESVFDYCERELDAPARRRPGAAVRLHLRLRRLPRLRAQGRVRRRARAPLAAARRRARVLRPADRLRPRRAPRPPARARRPAGAAAAEAWLDGHRAPARRRSPRRRRRAAAAGALSFTAREGRDAYLANIAACLHEITEGETYEVCLTTAAAQRRRDRPARRLPRPARPQPRAVRGAAALRRRLGAQLLARALPARRPRADRRVASRSRAPPRAPPTRSRTPTAPPRCAPTTSRAPRT